MKLLIIDDEELTRKGLLQSIDWKALNITEVFEADDGLNGLHLARVQKPEIILSDIRMPRMDGILMARKIKEEFPDTNIIFMSGYSDRDYLKAAIKLQAVSYVEKPINPPDVEDAVLTAIENTRQTRKALHSQSVLSLEKAGRLALYMTYPPGRREPFSADAFEDISLPLHEDMYFTTFILKSLGALPDLNSDYMRQLYKELAQFLISYGAYEIHVTKYHQFHVFHIFSDQKQGEKVLFHMGNFIKKLFSSFKPFFISIGKTVAGIEHVHKSYASAVTLLQSSFFYDYNSILTQLAGSQESLPVVVDFTQSYREVLHSRNQDRLHQLENKIYKTFQYNLSMLPNQVKDIYYRLFTVIQSAYQKFNLSETEAFGGSESILDLVQNCHTLKALHELLCSRSAELFQAMQKQEPEDAVIYGIKKFISSNYTNPVLSVKDISEHVHMSSSYVCTLFKNSTGMTLNQYITDFRMEKAKQLLMDSSFNISDISSRVGYSDGNYFGKSFKKHVGLSPSEYREKMLL